MRLKQRETDHTPTHYYYNNELKIHCLTKPCFLISYTVSIKRNGNIAQQSQCIYSDRYFNTNRYKEIDGNMKQDTSKSALVQAVFD
jgi:hypothetical protein